MHLFQNKHVFANTNLVAVSNSNNSNNIVAASNGYSFIAAISGNQGPFTGAKYFKGATPGTIKKPSAGVASMKTTIGFDGFTGVDKQSANTVPLWGTTYSWLPSQALLTPLHLGLMRPSNRLESQFKLNWPPNSSFPPPPVAMVAAQSIWKMLLQHDKLITQHL